MKNRKEGRKKRTRERQRKRKGRNGGGPKKAREKQRETLKNKQKMPFFRGKNRFLSIKKTKKGEQRKKKQEQKKQKQKENKEGLGPSEVALWATSPDP